MPLIRKLPGQREQHAGLYVLQMLLASLAAMAVAQLLGLDDPWWAALAVWIVSQPVRGGWLARGLAQLLGACLGAFAGAALMQIPDLGPRLAGLALWMALCCGLGNLMRRQRAPGAVMASVAAVIVALMSGSAEPFFFASMRVADTAIGVVSSLVFMTLWCPRGSGEALLDRTRTAAADALSLAGLALGTSGVAQWAEREQGLLAELAAIEAASEDAASDSAGLRRKLRPLRGLLAALLDVLAISRITRARVARKQGNPDDGEQAQALLAECGEALARLAQSLNDEAGREAASGMLDACVQEARERDSTLVSLLEVLQASVAAVHNDYKALASSQPGVVAGHALAMRNGAGAWRAALRCLLACLVPGVLWSLTGDELGRYVTVAACVFISVFTVTESPLTILRQVLLGGLGVLAGIVIFFAAMAQFMPIPFAPAEILGLYGLALLCGLLFSLACAYGVLPMSRGRRRAYLRDAMRKEIGIISARAGDPRAAQHLARLRYLALDLLSRAGTPPETAHGVLAALALGHTLLHIGQLMHGNDVSASAHLAARSALAALRSGGHAPGYLSAKLARAAMQVESDMVMMASSILVMQELGQSLRDASSCIAWQPGFLVGAGRRGG